MTLNAQAVIESFERLSEADKKEVATEIFRRSLKFDFPPLTDDELVMNAEDLFLELDQKESKDG
ncbi:MAG: hypothetical protein ACE5HS_17650 [bacterium]